MADCSSFPRGSHWCRSQRVAALDITDPRNGGVQGRDGHRVGLEGLSRKRIPSSIVGQSVRVPRGVRRYCGDDPPAEFQVARMHPGKAGLAEVFEVGAEVPFGIFEPLEGSDNRRRR